jgi:hypothetical protein
MSVKIAAAEDANSDNVDIELLEMEKHPYGLMIEEGITTISFYKGDFNKSVESIRTQLHLVVNANPWLTGRLVDTKGKEGICLRHSKNPDELEIDSIMTVSSVGNTNGFLLKPNTPYMELCTSMYNSKKVCVGNGNEILNKTDGRVSILTLSESTEGEFALIFSLSHVIGDGNTYYEIFKMLKPGASVRELPTKRIMSFTETMKDNCGRKELEWMETTSVACLYMCQMAFTKKARCMAFHLDTDRLKAEKVKGVTEGNVEYVTTNDILTSRFATAVNARIMMMGMDCRGRLPDIEKALAGNYVTALTMDPGVFHEPYSIRKMLKTMPYKTTEGPFPTCCGWACCGQNGKFGMVTNWSTFAGELIELEGCEMVIHLPVQNPAACVFDLMIPFSSKVGKIGVICWTVDTDEKSIKEALPVGECISKELFP